MMHWTQLKRNSLSWMCIKYTVPMSMCRITHCRDVAMLNSVVHIEMLLSFDAPCEFRQLS